MRSTSVWFVCSVGLSICSAGCLFDAHYQEKVYARKTLLPRLDEERAKALHAAGSATEARAYIESLRSGLFDNAQGWLRPYWLGKWHGIDVPPLVADALKVADAVPAADPARASILFGKAMLLDVLGRPLDAAGALRAELALPGEHKPDVGTFMLLSSELSRSADPGIRASLLGDCRNIRPSLPDVCATDESCANQLYRILAECVSTGGSDDPVKGLAWASQADRDFWGREYPRRTVENEDFQRRSTACRDQCYAEYSCKSTWTTCHENLAACQVRCY